MSYQIHASAIIDDGAQIGEGSRIWHFVHVCVGTRIEKGVSLGQNVFVGNKVSIGDHCKIQNNVSVYDKVTLEEGVFCGPSMVFTNVYNPRSLIERKSEYRDTLVGASRPLIEQACRDSRSPTPGMLIEPYGKGDASRLVVDTLLAHRSVGTL